MTLYVKFPVIVLAVVGNFVFLPQLNCNDMDIPRELFYEEKSLKDLGIANKDSIYNTIFQEWLLTLTDLKPGVNGYLSRIQQTINDARFICTLILRFPDNCLNVIPYYISKTKEPSVVMPMVYFFLSIIRTEEYRLSLLMKALDTEIKRMGWNDNLGGLLENKKLKKKKMDRNAFSCRELNASVLSTIDWEKLTNYYKKDHVEKVIRIVSKNEDEAKLMAKAITEAAKKSEEDFYNPEPYIEDDEYPDEPDVPDKNWDYTPDYSEVYNLCREIEEGNGYSSIICKPRTIEQEFTNKFAVKKVLQDFLEGDWFDEFSSNRETYTLEWRKQMIDDLLKSEWGPMIGQNWQKTFREEKYALVGVLRDCGIITEGKKKDLVAKLKGSEDVVSKVSIDRYMIRKDLKRYLDWMIDYVNSTPFEEKSD